MSARSAHATLYGVLGDIGGVVRLAVGRRDSATVVAVVTVGYLLAYLWATGDLSLRTEVAPGVLVIDDPLGRLFARTGPASFGAIATVDTGVVRLLLSPVNVAIGGVVAGLVGINLGMTYLAVRRPKACGIGAGAGLLALLLAIAVIWRDARLSARPDVSGPVLPEWSENAARADLIEIVGPDDIFTLVRTDQGWVMPSRGGYPVTPARIAELDAALSGLRFDAAMTRDPDKFERLGLVAPSASGVNSTEFAHTVQGVSLASSSVRNHSRWAVPSIVSGGPESPRVQTRSTNESGWLRKRRSSVRSSLTRSPNWTAW